MLLCQRRANTWLVHATRLENVEWVVQPGSCLTLETIAALNSDPIVGISASQLCRRTGYGIRRKWRPRGRTACRTVASDHSRSKAKEHGPLTSADPRVWSKLIRETHRVPRRPRTSREPDAPRDHLATYAGSAVGV